MDTLFICRQSEDSGGSNTYGYFRKFSGLFNSARLVVNMLNDNGIESALEVVADNNGIDRLVTKYKPSICIIEAYWVVPEKFDILHKLHPDVTWIVRIHSEIPFWSMEGIAVEWTLRYLDHPNVILAPNSYRAYANIKTILSTKYTHEEIKGKLVCLPNYYPADKRINCHQKDPNILSIGCFGAIRPYKNQLIQAIAAIKYAEITNRKLHFHINGDRIEGHADPIIKNLRTLFKNSKFGYELVEHAWMPHHNFIELLSAIDIGMQVSYSESFNIVAADIVTMNVPIVVSSEISWVNSLFYADPNDSSDIVRTLCIAERVGKLGTYLNRKKLETFSDNSESVWVTYITDSLFDNFM
jgi:hypothetical protein